MYTIYCSVEDLEVQLKEVETTKVRGSKEYKEYKDFEEAAANCKRIAEEHYRGEVFGASDHEREETHLDMVNDRCWKLYTLHYIFTYWF